MQTQETNLGKGTDPARSSGLPGGMECSRSGRVTQLDPGERSGEFGLDMWLDAAQKGQVQFLVKPRGWLAAQVVVARVGKDTGCGAQGILEG